MISIKSRPLNCLSCRFMIKTPCNSCCSLILHAVFIRFLSVFKLFVPSWLFIFVYVFHYNTPDNTVLTFNFFPYSKHIHIFHCCLTYWLYFRNEWQHKIICKECIVINTRHHHVTFLSSTSSKLRWSKLHSKRKNISRN